MCASRLDLPDRLVASKLASYALDPDFRLDFDLRPRLLSALSGIDIDQLSAGRARTSDDHNFEEIEPALAAFTPDLLANAYRTLVRTLPGRSEEDRDVLLYQLDTLTLLLGGQGDQRLLKTAWEQACGTWIEEACEAESDLFAAILFHAPAKAQLDLLLRRPQDAFDDAELGSYFKRLPAKQVRSLAQGLLESTPRDLQRKLWFLCYQSAAPVIEVLGVERIVGLLNHTNREVQRAAELWLLRSGSDDAFDLAIERGQITPASTRSWGAWFALRMRSRLSYETLAQAIDLGTLSYVVRNRPRDLALYTRDLDQALGSVVHAMDESFKSGGFCTETMKGIIRKNREVVEGWVRQAVGQNDVRSSLIEASHMMLEALCEALFETDPTRGVELFQTLRAYRHHAKTVDSLTDVDVLALSLFRIPRSEHADILLREWFDDCNTDKAVFELALAASAVHNDERLGDLIGQGLSSPVPAKRAAALMLSGFGVYGSRSAALLDTLQLHPEGWLHEVRERARRHLERDRWAQEWLRRFAASLDTEEAFAAFQLFLRCVDRRYRTWKKDVLRHTHISPDRRRYLTTNRGRIQRAIKENEKSFEKVFLGVEIPDGKVHPWLTRYLG